MAEPSASDSGDLARVRQALVRELESINTFEEMARVSQQPDARAALEGLAQRARENLAALTGVLRKLDPRQDAAFAGVPAPGPARPPAASPAGPTAPNGARSATGLSEDLRLPTDPQRLLYALPAPPSPFAGQFTVGPLKTRK